MCSATHLEHQKLLEVGQAALNGLLLLQHRAILEGLQELQELPLAEHCACAPHSLTQSSIHALDDSNSIQ